MDGDFSLFSESLLINTIMKNSEDTIYVKDLNSRFVLNSKAHARQFNLDNPEDMIGKSDYDYFPEDFAEKTFLDEQEIIRTGRPITNQIEKIEIQPGGVAWYMVSKYPLYDENGQVIGTWGTSRNVTLLKQAELALAHANEELKKISMIDDLSGLYNRRHFYHVLTKTSKIHKENAARGQSDSFCLVALDIDHFKAVNDTLGHLDGDEAIRHIGNLLRENCRSTDTVFRIGGDEYVILLLNTGLSDAIENAERIRRVTESTPLILRGNSYRLTVSMGVSCIDDHDDLTELIRAADIRLYHSKTQGRNRVT